MSSTDGAIGGTISDTIAGTISGTIAGTIAGTPGCRQFFVPNRIFAYRDGESDFC